MSCSFAKGIEYISFQFKMNAQPRGFDAAQPQLKENSKFINQIGHIEII